MERQGLQGELFRKLGRIEKLHFQYMHMKLEELDLYPGQPQLLMAIAQNTMTSQRDLAQQLHISAPTLTIMLKRMASKDLVTRESDRSDQRIIRLSLTPKGEELVARLECILTKAGEEVFGVLTGEQVEHLHQAFLSLCDHMEMLIAKNTHKP